MNYMNEDVVVACAGLMGRAGAKEFQIGYVHDDVPIEEAGWYAHAAYQGMRIQVQDHRSPTAAALALAEQVLRGGTCKCGQTATLQDDAAGCRWQLKGKRWESGCDASSVDLRGVKRGDVKGMQEAMMRQHQQLADQPPNRAARRKARRKK